MITLKHWSVHAASSFPVDKCSELPRRVCSSVMQNCLSSMISPALWMWKPNVNSGREFSKELAEPILSYRIAVHCYGAPIIFLCLKMGVSKPKANWMNCWYPVRKCASCGSWKRKPPNHQGHEEHKVK